MIATAWRSSMYEIAPKKLIAVQSTINLCIYHTFSQRQHRISHNLVLDRISTKIFSLTYHTKTITFGHLSTDISHWYHASVSVTVDSLHGVVGDSVVSYSVVVVVIGHCWADFRDSYAAEQIVGKPWGLQRKCVSARQKRGESPSCLPSWKACANRDKSRKA